MRFAPVLVATLLLVGCGKKSQDGLPPAKDWSGGQMAEAQPQPGAPKTTPHGSEAGGANPHAMGGSMGGGSMGGMPPGHPPTGDLPPGHPPPQGGAGGPDVTQMGLSAPDPNRKVDPSRRIRGVLKVDAKAKANVKAGGAVFLIVKKADANGAPSGPPLAVDKVTYADGLRFELTEAQAMVAGTELVGDVVVTARYDQDSDAISKQPGDVTGMVRVKVPADNVELKLDTVLP
ncbi:MAG: hypothetical protein H0T65_03525 [Deltaproteobacteria bacterium]|nr:hypothetical protein [Deltaproteobacteria bacterium]